MKEFLNDFDIWQDALKKIDMNESALPIVNGKILSENADVYYKIQEILNVPELINAHQFCLDCDVENMTNEEIDKVNKIHKLAVDRGLIQPKAEDDDATDADIIQPDDDDEPVEQTPQKPLSNFTDFTSQQSWPEKKTSEIAKNSSFTVMYSATKNGNIKTGESYSNAISPAAAKAEVLSTLQKLGYENISILAIEAGDSDMRGFDDSYTSDDETLADAKNGSIDDILEDDSEESDDSAEEEPKEEPKEEPDDEPESSDTSDDADDDDNVVDLTNTSSSDDDSDDDSDTDSDTDSDDDSEEDFEPDIWKSDSDSNDNDDSEEDDSNDDDSEEDDADNDDNSDTDSEEDDDSDDDSEEDSDDDSEEDDDSDDDSEEDSDDDSEEDDDSDDDSKKDDELDEETKLELKNEFERSFKNAMLKCEFEDKCFNDLTLKEKVDLYTELSKTWTKKYQPNDFMTDKQQEVLDNTVITL